VRPKMMTVTAIIAALLPILWSHDTGSELMQRIAVPMTGGMDSSTVLTLIVIPAVYGLIKGWGLRPDLSYSAARPTGSWAGISLRARSTTSATRQQSRLPNVKEKASQDTTF
jgi:hypothetical protein